MDDYIPFVLLPIIAWGVRHHLIGRNDYSTLKKITLSIGMSAYFVTEMGRSFYRPYIYANGIDDWVIADTLGNSFGTVTAIFMLLTMSGRGTAWDWRIVVMVLLGLVGYETLNLAQNHPFDVNDLFATLVFGALSAIAYARILARHGESHCSEEGTPPSSGSAPDTPG